jgi:hypothetical protein
MLGETMGKDFLSQAEYKISAMGIVGKKTDVRGIALLSIKIRGSAGKLSTAQKNKLLGHMWKHAHMKFAE